MNIKLLDTVTIACAWMPAIINGDYTGLSDFDELELDEWLKDYLAGAIFDCKDSGFWARDCVTGLMADCYEVEIYG
jgi:hypothetical protein